MLSSRILRFTLASLLCLGLFPVWAGTLQEIHDAGAIKLGYRQSSPPFSAEGANGTPSGYSIDLCVQIAQSVRVWLGRPNLRIDWVPVEPDTRLANVAYGHVHIECGSTTNTLSRQQLVDFSYTTYVTGSRLLVRKGEDINRLRDLNGKTLAVIPGTTTERTLRRRLANDELDVRVGYVDDHAQGFGALAERKVDAYVSDDVLLYGLVADAGDKNAYEVVGGFLSFEPYALVVRKDDSDFLAVVNATLARLFRTGAIEQIHARWFDPLSIPMPDLLRASFRVQAVPE